MGRTALLATVVKARSYSCISGRMSAESDTGTSGISSAQISAMRRSCAAFMYEFIRQTVIASTFSARNVARLARNATSSSARTTAPSAPMRSCASMVASSGAIGVGLGQMIQAASPPGTRLRAICRMWR